MRAIGPRSLTVGEWPLADQAAWRKALAPAVRLSRGGTGSHFAEASRKDIEMRYGAYLAFLQRHGKYDPGSSAEGLIIETQVRSYIAELQARVRGTTVYNCVHKLRRMAELLAPRLEIFWLVEIERDLKLLMEPQSKFGRVMFSHRLVEAGLSLIEEGRRLPNSLRRARITRNGLMIAILAVCPIRLRNFAKLEIGKSFQCIEDAWWIILPATNTKSGRRDERRIPTFLTPYIKEYLREARSTLLASQSNALWISLTTGGPLTAKNLGTLISKITNAVIGVDVSPHLFRTAAASTAASRRSDLPKLGAGVLGHVDGRITELHYNRARASDAVKSYAEILNELRASKTFS